MTVDDLSEQVEDNRLAVEPEDPKGSSEVVECSESMGWRGKAGGWWICLATRSVMICGRDTYKLCRV